MKSLTPDGRVHVSYKLVDNGNVILMILDDRVLVLEVGDLLSLMELFLEVTKRRLLLNTE